MPSNYILLQIRAELDEVGAVSRHAHQQVLVLLVGVAVDDLDGWFRALLATHFKDAELSLLHRHKSTISENRLALLNQLAAASRPVPEEVIAILKNCDNGVQHQKSGYSPTNEGTYQSIVFDIPRRRLFLSDGTRLPVSLTGVYREIALDEE